MEGNMKVAIMTGIGKMDYTTRPIPTPKDDEVLVKLEYVGICGSDLHYYESGAIGDFVVEHGGRGGQERHTSEGGRPGGPGAGKDLRPLRVLPDGTL